MTYQFEWDNANIAKIALVKKSGRIFSINEIESVFEDENKFFEESYPDVLTNESRFQVIGRSNKDNILIITFVFRNGKVRIFNVWKAKQSKLKKYNEKVRNLEK
jgi:uncharacterized DUF497 family protein